MAKKAKKTKKAKVRKLKTMIDRDFMNTLMGPHHSQVLSATINHKGRVYVRYRVDLEDSLGSDQLLHSLALLT